MILYLYVHNRDDSLAEKNIDMIDMVLNDKNRFIEISFNKNVWFSRSKIKNIVKKKVLLVDCILENHMYQLS